MTDIMPLMEVNKHTKLDFRYLSGTVQCIKMCYDISKVLLHWILLMIQLEGVKVMNVFLCFDSIRYRKKIHKIIESLSQNTKTLQDSNRCWLEKTRKKLAYSCLGRGKELEILAKLFPFIDYLPNQHSSQKRTTVKPLNNGHRWF